MTQYVSVKLNLGLQPKKGKINCCFKFFVNFPKKVGERQ